MQSGNKAIILPFTVKSFAKLYNILGSKWNKTIASVIHLITTHNKLIDVNGKSYVWDMSIELSFGACGIVCNHLLSLKIRVINDLDANKTKLVKFVRDSPKELIDECEQLCSEIKSGKETFITLRDAFKNSPLSENDNSRSAAMYIFLNVNSHYNDLKGEKKEDGQQKDQITRFRKKINTIWAMHGLLKNVTVYNKDMFKILNTYKNRKNTLFIVDPPYLHSTGYSNSFPSSKHKELCKCLMGIKGDFMLFCRTTTTRPKTIIESQTKQRNGEFKFLDDILRNFYDIHYGKKTAKRQCYYIDVLFYNNGTTERIITSFPFEGATECWSGKKCTLSMP